MKKLCYLFYYKPDGTDLVESENGRQGKSYAFL